MSCEGRIFDICGLAMAEMEKPAAYRLWRCDFPIQTTYFPIKNG